MQYDVLELQQLQESLDLERVFIPNSNARVHLEVDVSIYCIQFFVVSGRVRELVLGCIGEQAGG